MDDLRREDRRWKPWQSQWDLRPGVTYLNHGSFGPTPRVVQSEREEWQRRLAREPMDFFVRGLEGFLDAAATDLGRFVNSAADDLVFTDNATTAMNIVAASVSLEPGTEVLLTDHEYGAVRRIWQRVCDRVGAKVVIARLPSPLENPDDVVTAVFAAVTEQTRLIVVSHVTSPTAVILPVAAICRRARERSVPVCIDGPHAPAMVPVDLRALDCDYYCASCHKWLSAPLGSGFLYVHRRQQRTVQPSVVSWGGSVGGRAASWRDEFQWIGTRDPAGFLAVPAAISFLETAGVAAFRERTHQLARWAREQVTELTGLAPLVPDDPAWYGSMIALPIPAGVLQPPAHGRRDPLQDALWEQFQIEIPIVWWQGRRMVRVSCHLYTQTAHLDLLLDALGRLNFLC